LCYYDDYCPSGRNSILHPGSDDGDDIGPQFGSSSDEKPAIQWAPMYDTWRMFDFGLNRWVQVGNLTSGEGEDAVDAKCWKYEDWNMRQEEIEDKFDVEEIDDVWDVSHRMWILCCER